MHLVDQVHLVAAAYRDIGHVLEQLARVVDAGLGRRIDLQQVDEAPFVDLTAHTALATRRGTDPGLAVQRLGQNPRQRGLANATGACKQVGVMQPIMVQCIAQRTHHVFLTDHLGEVARAPFAGKNLV